MKKQPKWTSLNLSPDERFRIKAFADRGHRNVRNQVLVWLDAAEALYADVTPEIQRKADAVKGLTRPGALDETA